MNVAYVRVPMTEENEEQQIFQLQSFYKIDKWYIDKNCGRDINRPQLQAMLQMVRDGDTVYVQCLSRLAGNTKDLLDIITILNKKNVTIVFCKENIKISISEGQEILNTIYDMLSFEREILYEKQREGIAKAKQEGKYKGRKEITIDFDNHPHFKKYYMAYQNREITKQRFAELLGVSRPTLDKILKEFRAKQ